MLLVTVVSGIDAFEMKGLRKIPLVSWTAKKTNEWVFNKAGVKRELLDTVKARKLAYYDHTMRKLGSCLEKEIMQGTMPGARRRGRPRAAWMDNIKTWTGLPVEVSVRMTEDRDKWRKYIHGVANPRIENDYEQNRTEHSPFMQSSVYETVQCSSVFSSMGPQQQTRCGRFAAVGPAGRRYRSTAAQPALSSSSSVWMRAVPRCQPTALCYHYCSS